MKKIIYYSNTNESYNIAKYVSDKTGFELLDIKSLDNFSFDFIFLVIPVHYQNVPKEIKSIIKKIKANRAIVIATYGKMSYGNVLYEIDNIYLRANIVCASYVPVKHAYIKDDKKFSDFNKLDEIINMIDKEDEATITIQNKNIFANFFPIIRHRMGVRIYKTDKCINCGKCNLLCKNIKNGKVNNRCNRCLKCYYNCPNGGLDFKLSFFMKKYLNKKKKDEFIIYK